MRVRLARFARVRLLRHALPISLLILRKKTTVLQSTGETTRGSTITARKKYLLCTNYLYNGVNFTFRVGRIRNDLCLGLET